MTVFQDWKYISFAHPLYFLLLLLIPAMIWWQWRTKKKDQPAIRLTTLSAIAGTPVSWRIRLRPIMFALRLLAIAALTVALARPQSSHVSESIDSEGIDIVLSMDISGSMLAEDLQPNRIDAAKKVAKDFIDQRPTDRIGLVIFAGESLTQCPITIDHNVLKEQLEAVKSGMLMEGTAIGDGLATAVDRIRNSKGKSKVIILLTDGVSNTGRIGPETALEIAKAYKVRVYTIGLGSMGEAPTPVTLPDGTTIKQMAKVEIDEPRLKLIARETGGKYFRATSNTSLAAIYKEIDKLEKTKVEISTYKNKTELFFPLALIAIIALCLEIVLRYTVFRTIT